MKIGFISLGCPKNLVDGEVMLGLAERAGHEITASADDADVIVVNTCAFIDAAKQESIDAILEAAARKTDGRCRRLVVTGCLSERYREDLRAQIPEIDAMLGTGEVPAIVDAIGAGEAGSAAVPITFVRPSASPEPPVPALPTYLYDAETPRRLTTPRHYAYIKVAEGCDYACSFCIIPTLRGHYRSRPAPSIVREAEALVAGGARELLLVSQDTTFYGVDRGARGALARLLRDLNRIDRLTWIRLLYLYPTTIGDDVLEAMAECAKVCRYVDLPLQHASDAVLARMGRPGNRRAYAHLLDRIRARVPGVTVRTTFIVGFPGETERDIDELASFVREAGFDHVGVFTYSHEEGTRAHALADDVPAALKRERRTRIMGLQREMVARGQQDLVGTIADVMVDGPSPEHSLVLHGRLESQAPDIDSVAYLTDCDPTTYRGGTLVRAEVVARQDYDLVVRPLSVTATP